MVRVQELTVGEVYRNRNGWDYEDGSIEWDWSTWGHWPDGRPRKKEKHDV